MLCRKGGLIGLAAVSLGLQRETKNYVDSLLPPVLDELGNVDPRVRCVPRRREGLLCIDRSRAHRPSSAMMRLIVECGVGRRRRLAHGGMELCCLHGLACYFRCWRWHRCVEYRYYGCEALYNIAKVRALALAA